MLYEIESKVIVAEGDPDPLRCPDCRRIMPGIKEHGNRKNFRCGFCHYSGLLDGFRIKCAVVATARVLVPLG